MNPKTLRTWRALIGALAGALSLWPASAYGQADFFEGFNNVGSVQPGEQGPENLINQGWIFANNSDPVGPWAWHGSGPGDPESAEGSAHIQSNPLATDTGGTVSAWAILPDIANLQTGDEVSFYVRATQDVTAGQFLELRLSPSGGTDVGSGLDTVGDFTELLLRLDPPPQDVEFWTRVTATVPGPGRLALWHRFGPDNAEVEVDAFGVNQDPLPGPPLPGPGETVTWTLADSPIVVDSTAVIVETGTVLVDPGVAIVIDPGASLVVRGEMIAHGTAENLITISTSFSQVDIGLRVFGTVDLAFAQVTGLIWGEAGASILVADSSFPMGQILTRAAQAVTAPKLVRIDRCSFTNGGDVRVTDGMLAIRDSSFGPLDGAPIFLTGSLGVLRGYLVIDNVMFDGGNLSLLRERSPQTVFIDNVTVVNNTDGPGLDLFGWDFLLGQNNTIQNNLLPLELAGGLRPETTLPLTGNTNNFILAGSLSLDPLPWPDLGLPYVHINDFSTIGAVEFLPGTTVLIPPDVGPIVEGPVPLFHGLPDNPTVFQPLVPGQEWAGLGYLSPSTPAKVENAVFQGAQFALVASDAVVHVDDCLFQNNLTGSNTNTFGVTFIKKTRFFNNQSGVEGTPNGSPILDGQTNPNWFEGNATAVVNFDALDIIDAQFNYWGHPTGPTSPDNPGGLGDPISGLVNFTPFLTEAPDFNDHPPTVRLDRPFFYAEVGDRKLLNWEIIGGDDVVTQRVVMLGGVLEPDIILADNLPPDQRSLEFVVPPNPNGRIVVIAADAAGQVGFDQAFMTFGTLGAATPNITFTTPLDGVFTPGELFPVCWQLSAPFDGVLNTWLVLDGEDRRIPIGGAFQNCIAGDVIAPYVSTDLARIVLVGTSPTDEVAFFSDYIEIRPDSRVGDAPPAVTMLTPAGGEMFSGGGIVPVTWDASDDEGLREFLVQVSLDGGRGWDTVAKGLPPEARAFDWRIPASNGVSDARVRVIARDLRFQSSSDGTNRSFTITAGEIGPGDVDGDGDVDLDDLTLLLQAFGTCSGDAGFNPAADVDGDGCIDLDDLTLLLQNFGT